MGQCQYRDISIFSLSAVSVSAIIEVANMPKVLFLEVSGSAILAYGQSNISILAYGQKCGIGLSLLSSMRIDNKN